MDLENGIVDPGADCRMSILVDGMVVSTDCYERVLGVQRACVEESMKGDCEEVAEGDEKGFLSIEDGRMGRGLLWHFAI